MTKIDVGSIVRSARTWWVVTVFTAGGAFVVFGQDIVDAPAEIEEVKENLAEHITDAEAKLDDLLVGQAWDRCWARYESEPRCKAVEDSTRISLRRERRAKARASVNTESD